MGLFNRESDAAKALKEEWKVATMDAQNTPSGTATKAIASNHMAQAAKAYRDQVASDKKK